jgi:hypothetical protein
MTEMTKILAAIEQGDPRAAGQLFPVVYDELRRLAAQKLAREKPGQTLQATALVHEEKGSGVNSMGPTRRERLDSHTRPAFQLRSPLQA